MSNGLRKGGVLAAALAIGAALGGRVAEGSPLATPMARRAAAARGVALVVAQVPAGVLARDRAGTARFPDAMGEGGRLVRVSPGGVVRVLTPGFDSAAEPDVSFDGRSILFAAKKDRADPWCVWEMKADGTDVRRITCGAAGARQPVYQSTVYTLTPTSVEPWVQVAFVGTNPGETNEAETAPNTSLWSCKTDGTVLRRLTFNLSNDVDPVILPDGRMLYGAWLQAPEGRDRGGRVALVGVNEDGTDPQVYASAEGLRVKRMPAATADGVVFVEADERTPDGSGRLAVVSQRRPLHSHRSLTRAEDGAFRAPAPLGDGRLLVAWRPGVAAGGRVSEGRTFGIYRFDPKTGTREKVLHDPAWDSVQAKALVPRPTPDARSSVVSQDDPEGKLFAIDVGIHDLGAALPSGVAKTLRVVEGVPSGTGPPARRLLGELELAGDGSFQVQLPANTPVQLQLVDGEGFALRTSGWLWARNHAAQGCVGCHEDPERTPPNRFVKAISSLAAVLSLPPAERRRVTYSSHVKPIVEAKCLSCHGAAGAIQRLGGDTAALAPYLVPGAARRSRLLWHILGRNAARPWDPEAGAPAATAIPASQALSAAEVRAFVEWIDLGGQP